MAYLTGPASDWQTSFEKPISSQCPKYTCVEVAHSERTSVMLWTSFQIKCPRESSILACKAINAVSYLFFFSVFHISLIPINFFSHLHLPPLSPSAVLINCLLIDGQLHLTAFTWFRQVEDSRGYFRWWFDFCQRKKVTVIP